MNESFVFKNKKGATCGYIMARGRQLRIRLPEGMEKACLTAVYEDGERNFEGGFDGYETERPNDGGRLIGAYVTADGKMVLDTGTAARKAFENRKATACRPENRRPRRIWILRKRNRKNRLKSRKRRSADGRLRPVCPARYIEKAYGRSQRGRRAECRAADGVVMTLTDVADVMGARALNAHRRGRSGGFGRR